jgi:hypothetical protein
MTLVATPDSAIFTISATWEDTEAPASAPVGGVLSFVVGAGAAGVESGLVTVFDGGVVWGDSALGLPAAAAPTTSATPASTIKESRRLNDKVFIAVLGSGSAGQLQPAKLLLTLNNLRCLRWIFKQNHGH